MIVKNRIFKVESVLEEWFRNLKGLSTNRMFFQGAWCFCVFFSQMFIHNYNIQILFLYLIIFYIRQFKIFLGFVFCFLFFSFEQCLDCYANCMHYMVTAKILTTDLLSWLLLPLFTNKHVLSDLKIIFKSHIQFRMTLWKRIRVNEKIKKWTVILILEFWLFSQNTEIKVSIFNFSVAQILFHTYFSKYCSISLICFI